MIARLKVYGAKAATAWFHYASFKLGVFVGCIIGFALMAIAMVGLVNAPKAKQELRAWAEQQL